MAITYGDNIAANISSYVYNINEMAYLAARDTNFMTSLVTMYGDTRGSAARTRSEYGTANFNQITDADDLASQRFDPSVQNTLTPYLFGAQFWATDWRIETDNQGWQSQASRELGEAASKKIQLDITSNFSSLTGGTVGSAGGTLTWGNVFEAIAYLKQQNAPEPYYIVLQAGHWYHLGTAVVPAGAQTNAPDIQNEVMRRYFVGNFFGAMVFQTNDITSGTAAVGAAFSREALAFDLRRPFRIEPERDASKGGGGYELNATMAYGAGVWRPKFGVQIKATSVLP